MAIETPVLFTTAIAPPPGVPLLKLTDAGLRLVATRAAILFAATQGVRRMVVADATGAHPLNDIDVQQLEALGTQVEQIAYQQNEDLLRRRGKGFAEGLLIAHALEHSRMLQECGSFYKLTGKLICRNLPQLDAMIRGANVGLMFWQSPGRELFAPRWTELRFFLSTFEFAAQDLVPAYMKVDEPLSFAESCVYEDVTAKLQPDAAWRPQISGLAGGTGGFYFDESMGVFDREFPCWLRMNPAPAIRT